MTTREEVLIVAKGSPAIPTSWFAMENQINSAWYCTSYYSQYDCLGFMADVNQDGKNDIVMCYSYPSSSSFECGVWQETTDAWAQVDTQANSFDTTQERDEVWNKLLEGQFKLTTKSWLQIDAK